MVQYYIFIFIFLLVSILLNIYLQLNQQYILLIILVLFLLGLSIHNIIQLQNLVSLTQALQENQLNKSQHEPSTVITQEKIKQLSSFQPLNHYSSYYIEESTTNEIMNYLIDKAEKTNIFTFTFHYKTNTDDKMMQIEFVQQSYSYILHMNITMTYSDALFEQIQQLLSKIFIPTNIIQVWGRDIQYDFIDLVEYGYFATVPDLLYNTYNVQKQFKHWYNFTFPHKPSCQQLVEHLNIDGCDCTCIHRPYKSYYQEWSITRATAFTFNEIVDLQHNDIFESFAITKLAYVVRQQWNVGDLESFKTLHENNH